MLKTVLSRPLAVVTVFSVALVVSLLVARGIPLGLYPEVDTPILYISVPFPGAGPEEVEEEIVRRFEEELSGLEGLDSLISTSSEGLAGIYMEFEIGTDILAAEAEVRSRLGRITPFLPDEAREPILNRFDPSSLPVIVLSLDGDRSERVMTELAEEKIIPLLEGLEGIASVELSGGRETVVQVNLDQRALEAYNISASLVASVLAGNNYQLGAGSFPEADRDILIRTNGRYRTLEEMEGTVILPVPDISGGPDIPVTLADVARVEWGYAEEERTVLIDNAPGHMLNVRKSTGANSVDVAALVEREIPAVNKILPPGVELSVLVNPTEIVVSNLSSVGRSVGYGIFFAVFILVIFLRQFRTTLIIAISIPVSLIMTIAVLAATGHTINIVTIIGLAMGVGLIVDSSIVIIENIFRYRMNGAPLTISARFGTGEMLSPILASSLTTVAVFFPLILYQRELGFLGRFFSELAFTIILAIAASLLVAVFLVPVLSSRFLTIHTRQERPLKSGAVRLIDGKIGRFMDGLESFYARVLALSLRHRITALAVIVLILGASLALVPLLEIKMMPNIPETSIRIVSEFPAGTSRNRVREVMTDLNDRIQEDRDDVERIIMTAEKGWGSLEITLDDRVNKYLEIPLIKETLRRYFADYPEGDFAFELTLEGSELLASSGVDVAVTGTDWKAVLDKAGEIETALERVSGLREIKNGSVKGLPQTEILLDRGALAERGLNVRTVAAEMRILTSGLAVTEFVREGRTYDVVLKLREEDRSREEDLPRLSVLNSRGERVILSRIARFERSEGPVDIIRENQVRTVHVSGTLAEGVNMEEVTDEVKTLLENEIDPAAGVSWEVGGELDDFQESGRTMLLVMAVAALLVVAVMVAQFESFLDPLAIALALPLMFTGVIFIYFLTGTTLSMVSLMGVIMLLGIVVNNGIVLVDYTHLMRRRGMALFDACVESGRTRLRPVLMTTLTTVLAMVPLAFFPGRGGELLQPMGIAVVGGLTSSTLGTLILVPVLYSLFHGRKS